METLLKASSQSYSEGNEDKGRETNTEKREKDDQLQSNLSEMKEENERLKMMISRIMNDYQLLQTRISKIASSKQSKMDTKNIASHINHQEPHEFVTLSLGTTYVEGRKEKLKSLKSKEDVSTVDESLTLGLDEFVNAKMQYVSSSSHEETKSHENKETWPPSKVATQRNEDDESNALLSDSAKRARVSVRARCDAPTMNDGCQWRKYGQKVSKGNPCPRAYYRCTVAPNCPVRKQVQRCKDDVSVLITTYEGTHNHVLPVSATAMASTTAAAASMLSSGSIVSRQNAEFSLASEVASTSSSFQNMDRNQFDLQNQLMSPPSLHPTVTLDLTTPRQSRQSTYNKNPTYPWNLSYWQRHANTPLNSSSLNISNDIIAKAITSDPNFQSVLHTAISSYVTTGSNSGVQETSTSQKLTNSFTFDQGNEQE